MKKNGKEMSDVMFISVCSVIVALLQIGTNIALAETIKMIA